MAVIQVPTGIGFEGCEISLLRATALHRSPFTGKRQVVSAAFALWQFEGNVVALQGVEAGAIRSFLVQLEGRKNTFRLPIPAAEFPLSLYQGQEGKLSASVPGGNAVPTNTWSANTLILRNGDYFNIGDELKMAVDDVTTNGAGQANISFQPPLRRAVESNTPVKVRNPFIYLAADEDDVAKWRLKDFNTHEMRLKAVEAIDE